MQGETATRYDVAVTAEDYRGLRARVRRRLASAGLEGYVAFTPSNVTYLSGYVSYFLSNWWRMHGTAFVALGTEDGAPARLVLGDAEETSARGSGLEIEVDAYPMWVETRGYAGIQQPPPADERPRPAQWRDEDIDAHLRRALGDLGLLRGRVGTDLRFIPHATFERLHRVAPDVEWVDVTDLMYAERAIKAPFEIGRLQAAAELAEQGMAYAAQHAEAGTAMPQIRGFFHEGVAQAAASSERYAQFSDLWVIPGMGQQASIAAHGQQRGLQAGDLLKFDCGTTVGGYRSDSGRTFVFGTASVDAHALYEHLRAAHALAVEAMGPGVPVSEVYAAASNYMHANGYPGYRRGHFGHSVGLDTFHEEPPFLAPGDSSTLEAGMVLAVETPFYGDDLGPVMLEDLVLVTATGTEYLTTLPRTLERAGG